MTASDSEFAPLSSRYAETRERIVRTSAILLDQGRSSGLPLTSVAEAVRLRVPTLRYYFQRKDDLTLACVEHVLAQFGWCAEIASSELQIHLKLARFLELAGSREHGGSGTLRAIPLLHDFHRLLAVAAFQRVLDKVVGLILGIDPDAQSVTDPARGHLIISCARAMPRTTLASLLALGICDRSVPYHQIREPAHLHLREAKTTKDNYIQNAIRLMNNIHSYNASLEDLCRATGLTKGSFYHHFFSKDDLLRECFLLSDQTYALMTSSARALARDPVNRLHCVLDWTASARARGLLFGDFSERPAAGLRALLGPLILEAVDNHSLRDTDPDEMLSHVQCVLEAFSDYQSVFGQSRPVSFAAYAKPMLFGILPSS